MVDKIKWRVLQKDKMFVVEDLISTGNSSLQAVEALM
jgi:orotate phosphoribosyltransferase